MKLLFDAKLFYSGVLVSKIITIWQSLLNLQSVMSSILFSLCHVADNNATIQIT